MNRILGRFLVSSSSSLVAMTLLVVAAPVHAGDVLFVSDSLTDADNIPFVLSGGSGEAPHATIAGAFFRPSAGGPDDHDVTIIKNDYSITGGVVFLAEGTNPALAGVAAGVALADYCAVFWSASGPHEPDVFSGGFGADGGLHNDAAVFTSLDAYVASGGYVLVTGHDAATDPVDPMVETFVGGVGAIAVQLLRPVPNSAPFGTVSALNNALAVGPVALGGLTPGAVFAGGVNTLDGVQDLDYVAGVAAAEVTTVVAEASVAGASLWTERVPAANGGAAAGADFSKGRIAYVANGVFLFEDLPFSPGVFLSDGEDASWLLDPAYNVALVNFASNGCAAAVPLPDDPSNLAGRAKRLKVNLTWQGSATADHYNVFRMLDTEVVFQQIGMSTGTLFVDALPGGTTSAQYFVEAENASGTSGPSNIVTVVPAGSRR